MILDDSTTSKEIDGLPKIDQLNVLSGSFVNLEYRLPNGSIIQFLDNHATYLGNQLPCEFGGTGALVLSQTWIFFLSALTEKTVKILN